ncbi:MAG TPA: hypothetical protein VFM02_04080 [Candidatus Paceibacterota bacterium]|nr:hypothetical protein [Candidatus Paceibacterota bacterium]
MQNEAGNAAANAVAQGANVIFDPLENLWMNVVPFIPDVVTAAFIVIIGLIISPFFGAVARKLARTIKIDELAEKSGIIGTFERMDIHFTFSGLIGSLVKWFVLLAFFIAAANVFHWPQLSDFLYRIVFYIPDVIVAVFFVAFGLIAGAFAEQAITKTVRVAKAPIAHPELLGQTAKWGIIIFAFLAALLQLGIAEQLVMILYAGVVLALALAFGLGGREKAAKILNALDASEKPNTQNFNSQNDRRFR